MANWCGASLIVIGPREDVVKFARDARKGRPEDMTYVPDLLIADYGEGPEVSILPRPRGKPDAIFSPDMWIGEGADLQSVRMKSHSNGLAEKRYLFQIRNDDGRDHFTHISYRYPSLHFVLTYDDPNMGDFGSFLIRNGRSRPHIVKDAVIESVMAAHGFDPDRDDDENEFAYWEASAEIVDMAERFWLIRVYKELGLA